MERPESWQNRIKDSLFNLPILLLLVLNDINYLIMTSYPLHISNVLVVKLLYQI